MNVMVNFVKDWINTMERNYLTLFFGFLIILEGDFVTSSSQFALIAAVETLKLKYLFLEFQFVTRPLYFAKTALKLAAL